MAALGNIFSMLKMQNADYQNASALKAAGCHPTAGKDHSNESLTQAYSESCPERSHLSPQALAILQSEQHTEAAQEQAQQGQH